MKLNIFNELPNELIRHIVEFIYNDNNLYTRLCTVSKQVHRIINKDYPAIIGAIFYYRINFDYHIPENIAKYIEKIQVTVSNGNNKLVDFRKLKNVRC